jgi:hypothetical protein
MFRRELDPSPCRGRLTLPTRGSSAIYRPVAESANLGQCSPLTLLVPPIFEVSRERRPPPARRTRRIGSAILSGDGFEVGLVRKRPGGGTEQGQTLPGAGASDVTNSWRRDQRQFAFEALGSKSSDGLAVSVAPAA